MSLNIRVVDRADDLWKLDRQRSHARNVHWKSELWIQVLASGINTLVPAIESTEGQQGCLLDTNGTLVAAHLAKMD